MFPVIAPNATPRTSPAESTAGADLVRLQLIVRGQVQGVGFRPFVYRLAKSLNLTGLVRNDAGGALIEVQGSPAQVARFTQLLVHAKPPLAQFASIQTQSIPAVLATDSSDQPAFVIQPSQATGTHDAQVTVDTAVCPDCLRELFTASDRRHLHPLINCTQCGPRYSIQRTIPYDRPNTTMAGFAMCPDCHGEYINPLDRRFHAQPVCCPNCGPKVQLVSFTGHVLAQENANALAAQRLVQGEIIAIKGLGGFHLAVHARDSRAVTRLRLLKKRDGGKPFALMARDLKHACELAHFSAAGRALLQDPTAPIVMGLRKSTAGIAPDVAASTLTARLGVMLPYTPIHHLLFAAAGHALGPLVMTSGNVSDEPLVIDNDEAIARLGPLCDAMLWHDRPIERCVDDSLWLDRGDDVAPLPMRRARGYVPSAIELPVASDEPGLCVGGELKNTVAIVRGNQVVLSQHLGDLTHEMALRNFQRTIEDLCRLHDVQPRWIAHDLHPQYLSTVHAMRLAREWNVPAIGIQHHHAHAASVLAEHHHTGSALAIICDGTGYGTDGSIWGGELLRIDGAAFQRLAQLMPLQLPGGDAAAKDTRRSALALLRETLGDDFLKHPIIKRLVPDVADRSMLTTMVQRQIRCVPSSGAGRYFDAIAALLGICTINQFEAQAPMSLETIASQAGETCELTPLYRLIRSEDRVRISFEPLVRQLLDTPLGGPAAAELARAFHGQFAWAWAQVAIDAAQSTGLKTVALSGGVFCNELFTRLLTERLTRAGFTVLGHRLVPANDGGLSLGLAAVAVAHRRLRCSSITPRVGA